MSIKIKNNNSEEETLESAIGISLDQPVFGFDTRCRKIYLFGEIDQDNILSVIHHIHVLEKKSDEDIDLYINSEGGYVYDCLALIDVMDASNCDIRTVVVGNAASAACLIASNGTPGKRFAGKNAEFMFHEAESIIGVKNSNIEQHRFDIRRRQKKITSIFSKNTGKPIEDIDKMFYCVNLDKLMSASEAKKFGIVDKILKNKRKIEEK